MTENNYCKSLPLKLVHDLEGEDSATLKEKLDTKIVVEQRRQKQMQLVHFILAVEKLFEGGATNIAQLLLECISKVRLAEQIPHSLRKAAVSNIVLSGGGFMFAGVVDRFKEELVDLLERPGSPFGFLKASVGADISFFNYRFPPNIVNWSGGTRSSRQAASTTSSSKRSTRPSSTTSSSGSEASARCFSSTSCNRFCN